MATISSLLSPPNLLHHPTKPIKAAPKLSLQILKPTQFQGFHKLTSSYMILTPRHSQRVFAVAEEVAADPSSKAARRVYIGNIPRTVDNAELTKIVEEHGAVEKAEVFGFSFSFYFIYLFCLVFVFFHAFLCFWVIEDLRTRYDK